METGPGYNSKRQEAVEAIAPILKADPNLMNQIGDLWFRNMDFPGADIIADRLGAMNPLAKIDERSKIPPQVQMQLAASQQQMQQMAQQIQQLQMMIKNRQDVEQVRQTGEDRRAVLAAEVKLHDQNTRSITSQNKTEIDSLMKLILGHMDTARLEAEIAARNQDQGARMDRAERSIEDNMQTMLPPSPEQMQQMQQQMQQQGQMQQEQMPQEGQPMQ
jgi:hypothetical protein